MSPRTLALTLLALAALVPAPVSAHGAGNPREIDHRVLIDGTDYYDYGALDDGKSGVLYEGGHDLLVLDVREARDPLSGAPQLWFRLINQAGNPGPETPLKEVVSLKADGVDRVLAFQTEDNVAYHGVGFDAFHTIDVGDEFVTGAEGAINYTTWSLQPGFHLTDIRVQGYVGAQKADVMPGTYYYQGQLVGTTSLPPGRTYNLTGPRSLFQPIVQAATVTGRNVTWPIEYRSNLSELSQFLTLDLQPAGTGAPSTPNLLLGPADARRATVTVNAADAWLGDTQAIAHSNLGDRQEASLRLNDDAFATPDVLANGTFGQNDTAPALQRGDRYAYRFQQSGDTPIRLVGAGTTEFVLHAEATNETPTVRVWGLTDPPNAPPPLNLGDTLVLLNLADAPVRIEAVPTPTHSHGSPLGPWLAPLSLLIALGIARFRRPPRGSGGRKRHNDSTPRAPRTAMTTPRRARSFLACLLLLATLAPVGSAHPAPDPKDAYTRLVHDCVDDYYGGDTAGGKDGHDLIALDVKETHAGDGDALVFHLILNGGYSTGSSKPALKDTLSFTLNGAAKRYDYTTSDNQHFGGTFDSVTGPLPVTDNSGVQDGTRFALEGTVKFSTLALKVGDKIAGFQVDGYYGSTRGDTMPGTYYTAGQLQPDSIGCQSGGKYIRPDYALRGPTYYASLTLEKPSVTVTAKEQFVLVTLENKLKNTPQTLTLSLTAGPGVDVLIHKPSTDERTPTATVDLDGGASVGVHVAVKGTTPGAKGTIGVLVTTNEGGANRADLAYTVASETLPTSPASTSAPKTDGGKSPGIEPALPLLVLAFILQRRRR